jgi:5'-nucleotidase
MKRFVAVLVVFVWTCVCAVTGAAAPPDERRIVLLTTADTHSQIEEFPYTVKKGEEKETKMIGGMARLAGAVKQIRRENPGRVLLASSGDDLAGKYFSIFRGKATYALMNSIGYDVAALGNHEFDYGIRMLKEAAVCAKFPLIASNMGFEGTSLFKDIRKYYVTEVNGIKIGCIGLMTPDARQITKIEDPITVDTNIFSAADEYVGYLRDIERVDLVVALTHIGNDYDRALARKVRGIDVICGGHSHTLLPTGGEMIVEHEKGGRTIIVQSGEKGGFLGRLDLTVRNGKVTGHAWEAIMLDGSVPEDPAAKRIVERCRKKLPRKIRLGESLCGLDARREVVRKEESNLGNLITDAMRERFHVDAALINGGGIRGETIFPKGPLYTDTVIECFPFENTAVIFRVRGADVRSILELAVSGYQDMLGKFLQVSGIKFSFDPGEKALVLQKNEKGDAVGIAEEGARVKDVRFLGKDGSYHPCRDDAVYSLAVGSYIAGGGDGYFMFKQMRGTDTYVTVQSVIEDYIREKKQVAPRVEGRITAVGKRPAAGTR